MVRAVTIFVAGKRMDSEAEEPPEEDVRAPPPGPMFSARAQAAAGREHTLFLDRWGSVYACGNNVHGQLGLSDDENRLTPTRVPVGPIVQISAGSWWTLLLDASGVAYACGDRDGIPMPGNAYSPDIFTPVPIEMPAKIVRVAASGRHSVFLDEHGIAYTCGSNEFGQLGLGDTVSRSTPTSVEEMLPMRRIVAVAVGPNKTAFVDDGGRAYTCGQDWYGELGLGDIRIRKRHFPTLVAALLGVRVVQVAIGQTHTVFLDDSGAVYTCGSSDWNGQAAFAITPTPLSLQTRIQSVAVGTAHTILLDEEGRVYTFGVGTSGQLGHGDFDSRYRPTLLDLRARIAAVCAGSEHTILLSEEGRAYAFGYGLSGQLGCGDCENRSAPVPSALGTA